ncbi:JAB domain-containing protein [Gracilimonas tropica]|uniref:JAB domain-containing protein n=1 Tax=Gracilimonas tropica TaxID=454600 RepID=UPI000381FDB5|nr:JAB domain-containing protein [Gracilimonas tropica]
MPKIAEVSLSYKSTVPIDSLPTITSPDEAAAYLRSIWNDDHLELKEEFVIILLDNQKQVLGWNLVSSGGATATIVDMASIFQVALLGKAKSLILAHNHPSSNPKPSSADVQLSKRAVEAGKLLSIHIDDHLIIYRSGFTSLRNEGLM